VNHSLPPVYLEIMEKVRVLTPDRLNK